MVVPVQQQAGQQLGLAQEGRVRRGSAAHHKVVATPGAGVAAIGHELLGRQARLPRGLVQKLGVLHQLLPVAGGVDVHLDHAGVGRHGQHFQARIAWWRVAFEHDLYAQFFGCSLDGGQQVQVVLQARQRGHEDVEHAVLLPHLLGLGAAGTARVAHLHAQGGARQACSRLELARGLRTRVRVGLPGLACVVATCGALRHAACLARRGGTRQVGQVAVAGDRAHWNGIPRPQRGRSGQRALGCGRVLRDQGLGV